MKTSSCLFIAVLTVALMLSANFASAVETLPRESGFSGFIQPGIGYLNYKSNMVASFLGFDLSDKKTDSLTDSPNSQDNVVALATFSLKYTFASTRTQLFIGTDLRDLIRLDLSQQLGIRQEIGALGILQGGFLFTAIPAKVWKDPYVVNQNRQETSRDSNGARLVWDRIFGSGLQLQYTYRMIDVGSEKSGQFLGLPANERRLLERDGDRHIGEIWYTFNIGKKHRLQPTFIYTKDNRDGDAMTSDGYDFQLTYAYQGESLAFIGNALLGRADYDEKNPIYGKTQEDDRYGIQGRLYYKNPWEWSLLGSNPMNFYVGATYVNSDANIDFYDQEIFLTSAGVFFMW
jgi:opacity protein-like surface antigen